MSRRLLRAPANHGPLELNSVLATNLEDCASPFVNVLTGERDSCVPREG